MSGYIPDNGTEPLCLETFMQSSSGAIIRLELKYCEQCGGLWLRVENTKQSYCRQCARSLRELPIRKLDNRRTGGSGPKLRQARRAALHGGEFSATDYSVTAAVPASGTEVVQ